MKPIDQRSRVIGIIQIALGLFFVLFGAFMLVFRPTGNDIDGCKSLAIGFMFCLFGRFNITRYLDID